MKICDICATVNFEKNNYCTHCGNKLSVENICPFCGEVNQNSSLYCSNCSSQINPIEINDFDTLFSDFNKNLLENATISDIEYNQILSDIFIRLNYVDLWGLDIKDKILNLASIFCECKPKSRGYERGYIFLSNLIYYDDRLDESVQIATIIHELAHHILFTIIVDLMCFIFKVKPSTTLESFVWYFLSLPEFKLMNEYCAHTVEGRFIPYGYQNYGSFNVLVETLGLDDESLETMVVLGNSFANEIIIYLEKYIDNDLRDDIKLQYKKDLVSPNYDSILKETNDCFQLNIKNGIVIKVLYDVFCDVSHEEFRKELESIKDLFS